MLFRTAILSQRFNINVRALKLRDGQYCRVSSYLKREPQLEKMYSIQLALSAFLQFNTYGFQQEKVGLLAG